ncbi:guanylate cyclase [Patiriisocius marinistellae]|uniref:Guanylate cyclase n=1 Tax=Patiriisocius marinistellae TaxID=2494560 RepID=A0A5J4G2Y5_9FLAO|nr:heme NO-binding domain-containing protein [Patiriisocius marinistellae]GEQ87025.1 guanylate cyclase [Patiriisocius marinistellae]
MKGIVFTEFLELVEEKFGLEVVDKIITQSNLPSKGAYTAVGTYAFSEMLSLLNHLSNHTNISIDDLLLVYAEHFFKVIVDSYPEIIKSYKDPLEMLASIENHIHLEVLKIYPDAELPTFTIIDKTEDSLNMIYKSSRSMHYFGLGLMNKTFDHFKASATITMEKIKENGTEVKFSIIKN